VTNKNDALPVVAWETYAPSKQIGLMVKDVNGIWVNIREVNAVLSHRDAKLAELRSELLSKMETLERVVRERNVALRGCERLQAELSALREFVPLSYFRSAYWNIQSENNKENAVDGLYFQLLDHFRGSTGAVAPLVSDKPDHVEVARQMVSDKAVAVVLPARKTAADYAGYVEAFRSEIAAIYNQALDDVAALNPRTADVAQGGEVERLRSSAPDLLEALECLTRELVLSDVDLSYMESHFRPWLNKAYSAVAKAQGVLYSPTPTPAEQKSEHPRVPCKTCGKGGSLEGDKECPVCWGVGSLEKPLFRTPVQPVAADVVQVPRELADDLDRVTRAGVAVTASEIFQVGQKLRALLATRQADGGSV